MSGSGRLMGSGIFGDYEVHGLRKHDETSWWIEASRSGENPPKQYRVIGTQFYAVRINMDSPQRPHYELGDLLTRIHPQEKAAILEAIAKWEK